MKICELPLSKKLPEKGEFICPIYLDNTNKVLRRINIHDIANLIINELKESGEVEMATTSQGIRFKLIK